MDERLATGAGAPTRVSALDRLIVELTPVLWQVARAAGLSAHDAQDVVQTSWVSLLAHLDTIREPDAITAWLITTTRREAWKVAAASRRTQPADQDTLAALPDPRENPEESAMLNEEQRALWAALSTLPPHCQELLRIVAFVPRPDYDAVAARLGVPRGSVGPKRRRCLDKLGQALRDGDGGS
jgi:RNA polymerase sigma factor (sigma-70 family)